MPTVPVELAKDELEKVLSSTSFRRAPKLSGLLRYVAVHALDGNVDAIKEYTIGVEVFDRGRHFDPRTDNIVRSQAHRLRGSLAAYYAGEGRHDPIRIEMEPGSYIPQFSIPETRGELSDEPRLVPPAASWQVWGPAMLVGAALLAAAFWLGRGTEERPAEPVELAIVLPNTLRLDLDAGIGALAPDSRSIIIPAADAQGVRRLWLRGLDSQALRVLPGTEDASFPFWSPDGRQIAFFAQRRLRRIRVSDGNVQVVCDAPLARGGSWGSRNIILFAANTSGPLLRVPADGGEVRPAGPLDASRKEFVQRWPVFLPDGDRFLYYSGADKAAASGIWLGSLSGQPPQQVAVSDAFSSPSLAFDDQLKTAHLLYVLRGTLVSHLFDARSGRLSGKAMELASGLPFPSSTGGPFHAVNNRALVFVKAGVNRTSPMIASRDGRVLANPVPSGDFGDVQLSPDGRQLAFERRDPTLGTSDIYLFDLERQSTIQVSHEPGNSLNPTWFPDGERLLYSAHQGLSIFSLREAKGGELIASSRGGYKPQQITRDGKRVLTVHAGESTDFDVLMLDLATRQRTPVAVEPGNQRQARLSADERLIAYTSDDSGRDEIYVKTWDGQRVSNQRWSVSTDGGAFPLWQPLGGNELFYLSPGGTMMVARVEISAQVLKVAKPAPLFETKAFSYSAVRYPYSIFPDGRFLLNRLADQSGSPITIRLNWTPARP